MLISAGDYEGSWIQWRKKRWLETHFLGKFHIYLSQWEKFKVSWIWEVTNGNQGSFQWEITGLQYLAYLSWKIFRRSWTQQERRDNQGFISIGNHRFTIPGLSQWENIRRSWTQRERRGNQGIISMGNSKFRSVKLDIFILNTYSVKPLSLNRKEGTTRGSFQWEISAGNVFYISMGNYKSNWR